MRRWVIVDADDCDIGVVTMRGARASIVLDVDTDEGERLEFDKIDEVREWAAQTYNATVQTYISRAGDVELRLG